MILYYPVSALVTLFANILQNPNDGRARSDVKLMNVVVNFLSTLVSDESNGSIRRMLGLCGEFERIAKVVLDKAEKESHARKKRKNAPEDETTEGQRDPSANRPSKPPHSSARFSPSMFMNNPNAAAPSPGDINGFSGTSGMPPTTGISSDLPSNIHSMPGLQQDFPGMVGPDQMANPGFHDQGSFPASPNIPSFQQPFVPQDLWQMPMTIEWDWADMSTNFPVFEAGSAGQPPA